MCANKSQRSRNGTASYAVETETDMKKKTRKATKKRPARARRTATSTGTERTRHRRYWSAKVTEHSDALELEPAVFTQNPAAIARSLKRSAERSTRRKSSPFRSAMSMLSFYQNRAGRNLSGAKKRVLVRAKEELRKLYGR